MTFEERKKIDFSKIKCLKNCGTKEKQDIADFEQGVFEIVQCGLTENAKNNPLFVSLNVHGLFKKAYFLKTKLAEGYIFNSHYLFKNQ